jgi:hypothetical protein
MIVMVERWRKNKMVVMGVDVCMLDRALASPLALSSAMIRIKWLRFISRRIGLSYQNTSRLFEKVQMFELFDCC